METQNNRIALDRHRAASAAEDWEPISIMEFKNGKVIHETQYFAQPFAAPAWRSQWVEEAK